VAINVISQALSARFGITHSSLSGTTVGIPRIGKNGTNSPLVPVQSPAAVLYRCCCDPVAGKDSRSAYWLLSNDESKVELPRRLDSGMNGGNGESIDRGERNNSTHLRGS
jgi:hypothetical protein